jgi:putative chitinase
MRAIRTVELMAMFGLDEVHADAWVLPLNTAMDEWDISTLPRVRAFMAQVGHESLGLRHVREIWGPTHYQAKYERDFTQPWVRLVDGYRHRNTVAYELGNSEVGDGYRFLGRGPIQITGRANYRRCGAALHLPLEEQPKMLEGYVSGARAAGWYWAAHGCNELADAGDFGGITEKINPAQLGRANRIALFDKSQTVIV